MRLKSMFNPTREPVPDDNVTISLHCLYQTELSHNSDCRKTAMRLSKIGTNLMVGSEKTLVHYTNILLIMSKLKSAVLAFSLCGATQLMANLPVSRTASVQAVDVVASTRIFLGLPGHAEPIHRGQVSAVSSNIVTLSGTIPAIPASGAVALVVTGPNRGRYFSITSSTNNTVTLQGFVGSGVSLDGADQLELIPLWTLGSLPITNLTVGEEGDPTSGDKVTVVSATGVATSYYITDVGWRTEAGDVPSDDVSIPYGASVLYSPILTKKVFVSGVVPPTRVARESASGVLAAFSGKFGQSLTLASLESLVVQGELGDPTSGDRVLIASGGLVNEVYFADDGEWHKTSDDSVISSATTIPSGQGFCIKSVDSLPLFLD